MMRLLAGVLACLAMTGALVFVLVKVMLRRLGPMEEPDALDYVEGEAERLPDRLRREGM